MMRPGAKTVHLGDVDLPDGILVILDAGLSRYWRHDPVQVDLEIVGGDAEAAARAYDRQFDPRYLLDTSNPDEAIAHFAEFVQAKGHDASARVLEARVAMPARGRSAVEAGGGIGVLLYGGLWSVAVGFAPGARLTVSGTLLPEDHEFAGRFAHIDVTPQDAADPVHEKTVAGVMVDHGQFLFAGLEPMDEFKMFEPEDGLADYVFWGPDAEALAGEVGASRLEEDLYGWRDIAMADVGSHAQPLQAKIEADRLRVGVDYRPHCNLEKMNAQIRESEDRAGTAVIGDASMVACDNRWGDGIFEVTRLVDAAGNTSSVRIELATEQRMNIMRTLIMKQRLAIVSGRVIDGDEPIHFAERMTPNNPRDSGWFFSSGRETEADMAADRMHLIPLHVVLSDYPGLAEHILAPVGTMLRKEGEVFVVEGA